MSYTVYYYYIKITTAFQILADHVIEEKSL